ncbi:lycopene beta-cyclase [Oryzisolibacter propanilivorax]|uniref:Lycopene beta-cyclase n=1 Tax=Oryzisolibacter propanilivorax TaxID=1527607 RepID=A0A1G9QL49_9BURK|nr:lycopene beta-cyclase CrtY [Oryzisolibacter propanilivorax]SDM11722.1 lycopene beta-cyclase [Oryzisolibacter propanilivorax]
MNPVANPAEPLDLLLVGAGLANGLIALHLAAHRPDVRFALLEVGDAPGGNHTWSFHDSDLDAAGHALLVPCVAHRWPGYGVRFPQRTRRLAGGYASVTSERFAAVLRERLGPRLHCSAPSAQVEATRVVLQDGRTLHARCVLDGRGARASAHLALGFQSFVGQEVRTQAPHGLAEPVLMDATVAQHGAYRFVYVLPLAADRLLVEDTYYADGDALDAAALRARIGAYVQQQGWAIAEVLREERGVLPIVLAGDAQDFWAESEGGAVPVGLAAGLFHPTTGYSLPDAARLAARIGTLQDWSHAQVRAAVRAHALAAWDDRGFFRMLNRMLFLAAEPTERWRVMQRFYGLPAPLIERFYAARLTWADRLRLVSGRPPVPLLAAARAASATGLRGAPATPRRHPA